MKGYKTILRYGETFIEIKAANDLQKDLDNANTIVECARALHKTNLARIAELEEELSVWRSVFPSLAPRLFPEEEGKE